MWRRRSSFELYQSYNESGIVNFIKIQRIKWAAHVVRMNEDRTTKKFFNGQPIGTRTNGWLNLRWNDDLKKDLLVLRTKKWRTHKQEEGWPGKGFFRCQDPPWAVQPLRKEGIYPLVIIFFNAI
ncbi:uncharacterized protein TNCV_2536811 [Trichonephila clavipes]|nr:uncharacterized protein TNCV_2536811 [Trichonephila clavipes]